MKNIRLLKSHSKKVEFIREVDDFAFYGKKSSVFDGEKYSLEDAVSLTYNGKKYYRGKRYERPFRARGQEEKRIPTRLISNPLDVNDPIGLYNDNFAFISLDSLSGKGVGYLSYTMEEKIADIREFEIFDPYKSKGIGELAVNYFKDYSRKKDMEKITVIASGGYNFLQEKMPVDFWRKVGFKQCGDYGEHEFLLK